MCRRHVRSLLSNPLLMPVTPVRERVYHRAQVPLFLFLFFVFRKLYNLCFSEQEDFDPLRRWNGNVDGGTRRDDCQDLV